MTKYTNTPGVRTDVQESGQDRLRRQIAMGHKRPSDQFVKLSPTKDMEDAFHKWSTESELPDTWAVLSWFVDQGLGVSISRRSSNEYCVTVADGARRDADRPHLLSSWGPTLAETVLWAYYRHHVVLNEDWDSAVEAKPDRPRFH